MVRSQFQPGFRLSHLDLLVILAGAGGALKLYAGAPVLSLIVSWVLGHFFLFCNLFRLSRKPELIWAGLFLSLAAGTLNSGLPGWPATLGLSALSTLILITTETRKPGYHGIFWQKLNPGLPRWFERQVRPEPADQEVRTGT